MKKNFKKVLTTALASVMALSAAIGLGTDTVKADETPVELTLSSDGQVRAEGDPLVYRVNIFNSWTSDANDILTDAASFNGATKVEVTFTVSGLGSKTGKAGINMSNSDWGDVQYWFDDSVAAVKATNVDLTADGTYTAALETTGDYKFDTIAFMDLQTDIAADEGEKDLTITSGIDIKIDKIVVTGGTNTEAPTEESTEPTEVAPFDPAGSYNAYLGLQTPHWTFRDAWNSDNGIGSDNWGQWIKNNDSGQTYGVVTDATVAGNGTYTVSIKDFGTVFADDFAAENNDLFNLLYISTDIPLSDDIKVTDVKLIVDGSTKHTDATAFLDPDETEYVKILIVNIWNDNKSEISYYPTPSSSLEMQFTISGFNYDKAADETVDGTVDGTDETTTAASNDANATTSASADANNDKSDDDGSMLPIIIGVVAVVVVAAVVVVVMKKKK